MIAIGYLILKTLITVMCVTWIVRATIVQIRVIEIIIQYPKFEGFNTWMIHQPPNYSNTLQSVDT
jgi:hypothetical protein